MSKQSMGTLIAKRRKELGMTQLDLADQMGITDKAVSKWERDIACPDISSLPKLAEIFGMSMDELMQCDSAATVKDKKELQHIIKLILKVIPLAMGAAVVVLSALQQLDMNSGFALLGIGLFSLALSQLQEK